MLRELSIKNYKSILDDTIELGRLNVFIGENGCGKTNILEALAMIIASKNNINFDAEILYNLGIRVTKPNLTYSSFIGTNKINQISFNLKLTNSDEANDVYSVFQSENEDDINSEWKDITTHTFTKDISALQAKRITTRELVDKLRKDMRRIKDNINNLELLNNSQEVKDLIFEFNSSSSDLDKVENELDDVSTELDKVENEIKELYNNKINVLNKNDFLRNYLIYSLNTQALRGINSQSRKLPLGINGEGLDILLSTFNKEELAQLKNYNHLISWLEDIVIDEKDTLKFKGHKLGRSNSILYFRDKFMQQNNNLFAAENANEGALHILFYLALFISQKTPSLFAIDNIETGLNPRICRTLIKDLAKLAADNNKQALITTHNPAVLDGLNLHDDEQRLFVVYRNDAGHTKTKRIQLKPDANGKDLKLSEMWMRGYLGGLPNNF